MKIRNPIVAAKLPASVRAALSEQRRLRNFSPAGYALAKAVLLNSYLADHNLKGCLVSVSGGLDSAVVLGLVKMASRLRGSPIRKIAALCIPVPGTPGATGQAEATDRGMEVCRAFDVDPKVIDIGYLHAVGVGLADGAMDINGGPWAVGQLVSYLRTPILYYTTALMAQEGCPSILVGTTNRDEGGYLGYFGKASDGMVDVQLISDIHKSEVRVLAAYLGVPQSVLDVVPTGDMFDGKVDEEVFGASYDFVEFYLDWRGWPVQERTSWLDRMDAYDRAICDRMAENIEAMHRYNGHKYLGRSQAIHLDVLEAYVPGGWDNRPARREAPSQKSPVSLFSIGGIEDYFSDEHLVQPQDVERIGDQGLAVRGLLSSAECRLFFDAMDSANWIPAGRDGYADSFDASIDAQGSLRASTFSGRIASLLWRRLRPFLPAVRVTDPLSHVDFAEGHRVWRPVGVSSLLRFIRYEPGGSLVPHYDAPWHQDSLVRSMMSVVIYLSDGDAHTGGGTRFLQDPQAGIPVVKRDLRDLVPEDGASRTLSVVHEISPRRGSAVVFDHRVLHEGAPVAPGGRKTILHTDVLFERCDWWRA